MNTTTKFWSLMTATLASGLILSGTATAAPIVCSDDTINHMTMDDSQASACLASGLGNIAGDGPDPFLDGAAGAGYQFLEKLDIDDDTGPMPLTGLNFTDAGDGTGTWLFDSSLWGSYGTIALGFKYGGGNEPDNWFVYELVSGISSGDWTYIADKGQGLSHMNVYAKGSVSVPEPGTLALLGLGLVGFTLARRKNRTS